MSELADWLKRQRQSIRAVIAVLLMGAVLALNLYAFGAWFVGSNDEALIAAAVLAPVAIACCGWFVGRDAAPRARMIDAVLAMVLPSLLWFLFLYDPLTNAIVGGAVAMQLAGLAAGTLVGKRNRSPAPTPACASCGYALTGLPPNAPCPECGAPTPRSLH